MRQGLGSADGGSAMRRPVESIEDVVDEGHEGAAAREIFGTCGD